MSGGGVGAQTSSVGGIRTPADVADVGVAGRLVEVADVMGGVARRVEDAQPVDALAPAQRRHVRLGNREHLAPEPVHLVAVEPGGALAAASTGRSGGARRPRARRRAGSGKRATSVPVAPAWSRWMWVRKIASGSPSSSSASTVLDRRSTARDRSARRRAPRRRSPGRGRRAWCRSACGSHHGRVMPARVGEFPPMSEHRLPERDRPWVMRTYAGHSDARRSNELYRRNLAKGQTGLSIAFDLPTQTGYDPDADAGARRGRQGRRLGRPPRRHGDAASRGSRSAR